MLVQLEIEGSPRILFELFETNSVSTGMIRDIPGGATVRYSPDSHVEKRSHGAAAPIFDLVISTGGAVVLNLLSSWLYDKLKKPDVHSVRINRRIIEVTPEGIKRAIEESIEYTKKP